ncbi:MAG: hypothetical protein A4E53_03152 [Pelotomaculum sp. PtaB.Bin104]|nr:MAG: hypothetical protein A4E53_03152 [Pelotomaculum sp. PtaB.Bin104]
MEEKHEGREERVTFNYKTGDVKYYVLTEGSGYPLAEFTASNITGVAGNRMVIPESITKTAKTSPLIEESLS